MIVYEKLTTANYLLETLFTRVLRADVQFTIGKPPKFFKTNYDVLEKFTFAPPTLSDTFLQEAFNSERISTSTNIWAGYICWQSNKTCWSQSFSSRLPSKEWDSSNKSLTRRLILMTVLTRSETQSIFLLCLQIRQTLTLALWLTALHANGLLHLNHLLPLWNI